MSSLNFQLNIVQQYLTRYGMTIYTILGDLGLILNIFFFLQTNHRHNSCSLYKLSMSICGFIGLNSAVIPIIYSSYNPDLFISSLFFCRFSYYFRHAFSQMMRTFIVLSCWDHYFVCKNKRFLFSTSLYQISIRLIPSVILFWLFLAIYPTMLYSIDENVCDATKHIDEIMYTIYIFIVLGIFPLVSLITFGLLIRINLQHKRTRIQPADHPTRSIHILHNRDRDMIRLLSIELLIYTCTTLPNTMILIYKSISNSTVNNLEYHRTKSFVFYFTRSFLLYLNNGLSFWIYISVSHSFRMEFKQLISKFITKNRKHH
ncbi:unnamed protein product [Adineta ricciae]|uniref:G-protein coupled receptors family 1 profile domain-containing protein n=1 Tax=Adineta ricciae TaxID=249248 RepID=A0A814JZ05_ADIRI|nr:unnamed protein product [Adineta ricciae]